MQKTDVTFLLKEKIVQLEIDQARELSLVKEQFKNTLENLKPLNLIKNQFVNEKNKESLLNTTIGLTSGYLAKKIVVSGSKNPLLKIMGTIIGIGVGNLITKHPDGIKSLFGKLIGGINSKNQKQSETEQ